LRISILTYLRLTQVYKMYTIETIEILTGYSKNTIYNLTSLISIKPFKNRIPGNPSKGTYNEKALEALLYYKKLTQEQQINKKEAVKMVLDAKIL